MENNMNDHMRGKAQPGTRDRPIYKNRRNRCQLVLHKAPKKQPENCDNTERGRGLF